jgi:hypothetical protein
MKLVCFRRTAGMFEIAHPDAVVMSILLEHTTANGPTDFFFKLYRTYAPTLLPTEYGKTNILSLNVFPYRSWFTSLISPFSALIIVRKFMGVFDIKASPSANPFTMHLHLILFKA